MIKMTVLYSYDKAVAKLSKVYGVSKQVVKDHFDDMNVELFYQTRKAFGREYTYWMIEQSDIEDCRQWLNTHSKELAKEETKRVRNSKGYVLDNHKDEALHFNTQREIADFLGYKNVGFAIGKVYRGYELKRETTNVESSVPENNSIRNIKNGESVTNHTIVNDSTGIDVANADIASVESSVESSVPENNPITNTNTGKGVTNHTIVNDSTGIDIASIPEHQLFTLGDLDPEPKQEAPKQESKPKSDFESKIDAYFEKYYGDLE